jgi:tRNA A-37 threonylcarbamoyl transferase component Bud32
VEDQYDMLSGKRTVHSNYQSALCCPVSGHEIMELPAPISISLGIITITAFLGKGKSGYSYRGELNGRSVVFKKMHNEPVEYYQFNGNKVELELNAFQTLRRIGIPMPDLILAVPEEDYLVKEFLPGKTGHEWVASGGDDPVILKQLFAMAHKARMDQINLDYFPPNFVISNGKLFYVDYEMNPYSGEWSLENWGIYYWANQAGMADYLKTGGWEMINQDANSGIPIKEPFTTTVSAWIETYSDQN